MTKKFSFPMGVRTGRSLLLGALLWSSQAQAVEVFNQPFTSSNSVSSYFSTTPNPTTQFDDISAGVDGGTWSITANHELQLTRTGSTSVNNGAGFTRCTPFLGPPSMLVMRFKVGLSGGTGYSSTVKLDVGRFTGVQDYHHDGYGGDIFSRLSIDSFTTQMRFKIAGVAGGSFSVNGAMHSVVYYLNGSGSTQSYIAPNGSNQTISNNCVSLWVDNTVVFNNVAKSGNVSPGLMGVRMHLDNAEVATWKFSDFSFDNGLPNQGVTGKIALTPASIVAEEAEGEAGLVLDEQAVAGDPVNGLGGVPLKRWFPGYETWFYPQHAIIDLGGTYNLSHILVYNYNGTPTDSLTIHSGTPFNWSATPLVVDPMNKLGLWTDNAVSAQTRYLRLTINTAGSVPPEIVVYGSLVGSPVTPPTPVTPTPPNMENFIGVNAFFNEPLNRISTMGIVREYHNWRWVEGDGYGNYPGYPNNQNAFSPNGFWWDFDLFYRDLKNMALTCFPCIQGGVSWINGSYINRQVPPGADPLLPASYVAHADHMYQMVARYGSTAVADSVLKLNPNNSRFSGQNLLRYYEDGNEVDGPWSGADAWYKPYHYAAMASADYDGHRGAMGLTVGVKNADPNAKMVMQGLGVATVDYVKAMKYWSDYYRAGSFPADVINTHIYATNGNQIVYPTTGISPEAFGLKEKMEVFRTYRDQYLPGKEFWVTEFGYDTNPGSAFAAPAIGSANNEEVQGQWLIRSYLALAAAKVDRATAYMLSDVNADSTQQFSTCGLLRMPSTGWAPKPSWYYVSAMRNRLTGLHYDSEQSSGNANVKIYRFADSGNVIKAYAVWCPSSTQATVSNYVLTLQGAPAGAATLISLADGFVNGVATPLTVTSNTVTLNVSERPVFVRIGTLAPEIVPDQKITLTASMVTNESGLANAGMLVDEQTVAGDPDNGQGGSPTTTWVPSYTASAYPLSAYIDLGQMTSLSKIYIYDGSGSGNYTISIGSPGNWTPVLTDTLLRGYVWKGYVMPPGTQTRYVRCTPSSPQSQMVEMVLYKKMTPSRQVLFDFGNTTMTTSGNWNNITTMNGGVKIANAVDSTGATTGMALNVTAVFASINTAGSTSTSGAYPATAIQDTFFVQDAQVAKVKLQGLNPSSAYTLKFFASRMGGGTNRIAQYKVGTATVTLDATDNVTNTVNLTGLIPAADGSIEVEIKNIAGAGYGYLGVLEVQW